MQCSKLQPAVDSIHKVTTWIKCFSLPENNPNGSHKDTKKSDDSFSGDYPPSLPPYTRDESADHVKASLGIIALAAEPTVPATFTVESVYVLAVNGLITLYERDGT